MKSEYNSKQELNVVLQVAVRRFPIYKEKDLLYYYCIEFAETQGDIDMPTLDWIGKSKVVNHHLDVPYKVLERQYSFDKDGKHAEDNGSENMIIHGDNLEALKSLLPKYEGRIKCIYIDIKTPRLIQFNYSSADFAA